MTDSCECCNRQELLAEQYLLFPVVGSQVFPKRLSNRVSRGLGNGEEDIVVPVGDDHRQSIG